MRRGMCVSGNLTGPDRTYEFDVVAMPPEWNNHMHIRIRLTDTEGEVPFDFTFQVSDAEQLQIALGETIGFCKQKKNRGGK